MAGYGFSHQPQKVEKIETKFRRIHTDIPVPESTSVLEEVYRNEQKTQMKIRMDSGKS